MQKVTLTGPHTHNGKKRVAGETIEVSTPQAKWLGMMGLIKAPTAPSSPTLPAPEVGKRIKQENDDATA